MYFLSSLLSTQICKLNYSSFTNYTRLTHLLSPCSRRHRTSKFSPGHHYDVGTVSESRELQQVVSQPASPLNDKEKEALEESSLFKPATPQRSALTTEGSFLVEWWVWSLMSHVIHLYSVGSNEVSQSH